MLGVIDNPIPFNEDMSKGGYINKPFTEDFITERSKVHNVSPSLYKEKLALFLELVKNIKSDDDLHLYFGEDETCLANRRLIIDYFFNKVMKITLHIVNEYTGEEIKEPQVLK